VNLIPKPVSVTRGTGSFALTGETVIYVDAGNDELRAIGEYLAAQLKPATGLALKVLTTGSDPAAGNIFLTLGTDSTLGDEGYELTISPDAVKLTGFQPAGLFRGVQTLRQLLPPAIESQTAQPGPWTIPAVTIRDYPRFAWRGAMLDVARHFFSVQDVERFIDLLAYYKMNRLHLHLTDDQGWRIEIKSWPLLAEVGGSTEAGGREGGYYAQADYAEIVEYAAARYILVVPEIDMPGHTNAAGAAYPELSCAEKAPELYTGTDVGFSLLCTRSENTYRFIDDVIGELAALTPGPYIHIGGDEALTIGEEDYQVFVARVQEIVSKHGKQVVGWEEIAQVQLLPTSIAQHWASDHARTAVQQGAKVILSPASKAYMDMKYEASTALGHDWAGYTSLQDAYVWDPGSFLQGVTETDVLGIEAPLWTETIETIDDIEFMAFPRLPGYAEIGWSPAAGRNWSEYHLRLAEHGPRLTAMQVDFFRAPEIPWK
jgi:hexosaminidase